MGALSLARRRQSGLAFSWGAPFFQIRDLCERRGVAVFFSNFQLYGDMSGRIMQVLTERAGEIEIYSIDEAFLFFPKQMDLQHIVGDCSEIRSLVKRLVGIPTSIGIGPTKTLAKVAGDLAKKDPTGVVELATPSRRQAVLETLPVKEVWGIGTRLEKRLHGLGIRTGAELCASAPSVVRKQLGVVGERILYELQGISCLLSGEIQPKKTITRSRSFGKMVTDLSELAQALSTHVASAARVLREEDSCAKALCAFADIMIDPKTNSRQCVSAMATFAVPTNDTPFLIGAAKDCLLQIWTEGHRYKKCGIILLDLVPQSSIAPDLFSNHPNETDQKRRRLASVVDGLNDRFGKGSVIYGAMGVKAPWQARACHSSSRFSTNWDELPIVYAH